MSRPQEEVLYYRVDAGGRERIEGGVIAEHPLSLTVNGEVWLTFMCTPLDLEALALGFLFNEGVIDSLEGVRLVEVCPNRTNVDVWLSHGVEQPADWRRTSGCTGGLTAAVGQPQVVPAAANGVRLSLEQVAALNREFALSQELYRQVRGVHASALSDGQRILFSCEDIGRHNTLDKIAGRMLLESVEVPNKVLLTSGRISSEMLQKAARMGAKVLISHTSPTSMSIELARRAGITLIGYARGARFNLYTHPQRIEFPLPELGLIEVHHA